MADSPENQGAAARANKTTHHNRGKRTARVGGAAAGLVLAAAACTTAGNGIDLDVSVVTPQGYVNPNSACEFFRPVDALHEPSTVQEASSAAKARAGDTAIVQWRINPSTTKYLLDHSGVAPHEETGKVVNAGSGLAVDIAEPVPSNSELAWFTANNGDSAAFIEIERPEVGRVETSTGVVSSFAVTTGCIESGRTTINLDAVSPSSGSNIAPPEKNSSGQAIIYGIETSNAGGLGDTITVCDGSYYKQTAITSYAQAKNANTAAVMATDTEDGISCNLTVNNSQNSGFFGEASNEPVGTIYKMAVGGDIIYEMNVVPAS